MAVVNERAHFALRVVFTLRIRLLGGLINRRIRVAELGTIHALARGERSELPMALTLSCL